MAAPTAGESPNATNHIITAMDLTEATRRLSEALARVEELANEKFELIAKYESKLANFEVITAAIADPSKDDTATLEAIKEAVEESKLSDLDRERLSLQQQIDELQAKLDSISDSK